MGKDGLSRGLAVVTCPFFNSTVVTVFLGIRLPDSSLDNSALYAMIVYCVGVGIVIVFEFYLTLQKTQDTRAASFSPTEGDKDGGE